MTPNLAMALTVVFVLLQILDVMSTLRILRAGGRELNPIMNWVMKNFGREQGLIGFKTLFTIGIAWLLLNNVLAAGVLVGIYFVVVGNNVKVMRGMGIL